MSEVLYRRMKALAREYSLPEVSSVTWAVMDDYADINSTTGEMRVDWRLRAVPAWVLDAVIVHELCHLVAEPGHGEDFVSATRCYPRMDAAEQYLATPSTLAALNEGRVPPDWELAEIAGTT